MPSPKLASVPDSNVIGPPPNNARPATAPTTATSSVAASANTMIAAYFTASIRVRFTGTARSPRSVPTFASPAIASPEIAATANGRNSGSSTVNAASATNSPLDVMLVKKSGPPLPDDGALTFTAIAMVSGTAASTARPAQLRRRPKISRSSERKNLVLTGRGDHGRPITCPPDGCSPGLADAPPRTSTADIEALPGQRHEDLFQVRCHHREPPYRNPVVDEGAYQL